MSNLELEAVRVGIFDELRAERAKQDRKWGFPQLRSHAEWGIILAEEFGEASKEANELHFGREELAGKLEDELVQTAAVCVSWLEHLRTCNIRG